MALTVTITNAGRAELINAQNTGTNARVIDRIGVSSSHITGNLKTLTALPNERKKLTTFGGEVVADDVIHVTINDTTADTYALRAFGLYFSSGTLFAVCTSSTPIMEKSAAAMLLQAVDITLTTLDTASIQFGGTGFTNPPATTEQMGVVELATTEETVTALDTTRAVTPFGLGRALVAWGTNFAAKAHRHVIGDIDGLSDALAAKANRSHTHGAADVNSGTFHVDRIPKLTIGWINGLADQLAGLAIKDHKHDAADTTTGAFNPARIPALPLDRITGLVATLADKASALHSHTMAQVSGLIDALAAKAPLNAPIFSGVVEAPQLFLNASASVGRRIVLRTAGASRWALGATGSAEAGENAGSNFSIDRYSDTGAYIAAAFSINRATGQATLSTRPNFGTATPWDTANFDPGTKADLVSPALTGNPTAPTQAAGNSSTRIATTAFVGQELNTAIAPLATTAAMNAADALKAPLASPAFTGTPTAPTQVAGNNSTRIATTAFVRQELNTATEPLATTAAMNAADALKAPLASPALTGNPTAPTAAAGNSSTRIATTAFVRQELSTAIEPLATTAAMNAADALKAPLASPSLTGTPTAPTQAAGNNSTRIATTAFVRQELNTAIEPLATTTAMNAADALKAPLASPALTGTPTAPTQPSGNNSTRLATTAFVQSALTSAVSAGAVSYFARATAPAGWLAANGAAVSRTTYADLFAAIGTTFGAGNGSTTFNLPDLRGEFVRGLDDERGIDTGRSLGSAQASQNLAHTHEYAEIMGVDNTQAGAGIQGGWFSYGATTSSSGGAEARPRNIALLACIKF